MVQNGLFKGIIPPVSTIFNENLKLDRQGMGKLIDFLIDSGVHGLFFLGSGGEFSQMSFEERKEVAAFATEYVKDRVPVLIGTGGTNTREIIALNQHAKEIGADGVVIINPYYWPLTEENLLAHYGEIAENTELPILLYNFPNLTGQDLTPEIVLKLVDKYPNIVGIKETVDMAGHIREMILKVKSKHPHFSVLAGFDDHLLNTLSLGGDGSISASGNFAPELTVGIYQAFQNRDYEKAIELHKRLAFLPLMYKLDSPFVNVVKEATKLRGLDISTHVLPPARPLSEEKKQELIAILKDASLL
ncbi:dihydrodipicolinate synthase family protein [Tepidibacillus fermentans]|uniref:4-hydroxy-tetrahydrodipicolinate synthase n=1 Tax=Tepidibacillus fermentans TaxID=1281767 RepID=A0A4R3K923_9BACI|nr:dihydrodipicolinate synthase family protein [Tepidibacillus fermentans]TCS79389.1 4-hydroxy-tetrahydrodipicolinate synthase [Tepidibacillus fermentans]